MKELKQVTVNYIAGNKNPTIVFANVKRVQILHEFLEINYGDSEKFSLKLENLVFFTVK